MNNKEFSKMVEGGEVPPQLLVPLDAPVIDDRGIIQNLLLSNIGSVAIITSKAGSVRSNHWHLTNWHYLYVITGKMKYLEKDLDGQNLTELIVNNGEMVFTPTSKIHRTEFLEDTILLSLGKTPKDHDSHEKDVIRVEW